MRMKTYTKSNAENWLDMSLEDLDRECASKNNESNHENLFDKFYGELIKFMDPIEEQGIAESDFVMHHIYNSDLVNKLKEVISAVQNCLDEENRLDSESVAKVMGRVLKAHAMKIVQRKSDCYLLFFL